MLLVTCLFMSVLTVIRKSGKRCENSCELHTFLYIFVTSINYFFLTFEMGFYQVAQASPKFTI